MFTGLVMGLLTAIIFGLVSGLLEYPAWVGGIGGSAVCLAVSVICQSIGLP